MKCIIWLIENKTKIPTEIYKSDNEEEFSIRVNELLKDKENSYGFRIERK